MTDQPEGPDRPGPIGGDMAAIVFGLTRRMQLPALTQRHSSTFVLGLFSFVNGLIAIAAMAFVAFVSGEPFVFPSLGPTAFLLFYTPLLPASSPRNTLGGHAIGAAAGYFALVVFGLTSGAMVWARVPHPPAGATTLIVSLGILREPEQLAVLMLAVALLVLQAWVINRLAGIPYPVWSPRPAS